MKRCSEEHTVPCWGALWGRKKGRGLGHLPDPSKALNHAVFLRLNLYPSGDMEAGETDSQQKIVSDVMQ